MPEKSDGLGVIKYVVCAYCKNNMRKECIEGCAPEGLYRHLEPRDLRYFESPPTLPSMARQLEYAPITRLALTTLVLHYLTTDHNPG